MSPAVPYSRYIFGSVPWYSVLIVCGVAAAFFLCTQEEKRRGLAQDTVIDLLFWVLPLGIVGARLYYVIFSWDFFRANPLSILYIWEGGLAIYGGVIGGFISVLIFSRRRRLSPWLLTDMIVPGLALAQAIGRWGNYFNMEAYGVRITDPALQFFPLAVAIPDGQGYSWHMATFFYESMWNLCTALLLYLVVRKRAHAHGTVTLWYFLLYGLGRFIIEGFRTDSLYLGPLRVSQVLSLAMCLFALVTLLLQHIRSKGRKENA